MNIYKVKYFNSASKYTTLRVVDKSLPAALQKVMELLKTRDWAAEIVSIEIESQSVIL